MNADFCPSFPSALCTGAHGLDDEKKKSWPKTPTTTIDCFGHAETTYWAFL